MREGMEDEIVPSLEKTDDPVFEDIKTLTEKEGWQLRGNVFQRNQTYQIILSKEGEKDKIFYTRKPYPRAVDIAGKIDEIP